VARVIDVATDQVRIPVARERVVRVAELVLGAERVRDIVLSITFVSEREIARLNWTHLRHRGPTDVISFGFAAVGGAPRGGDVYISPEVARRNARAHAASVREELLRLVIHGVLHVLDYDHPEGDARYASRMWKRQETLLGRALALS